MGTKPVTRDDGKTVTGYVYQETERANEEGAWCYHPTDAELAEVKQGVQDRLAIFQGFGKKPSTSPKWPATPAELDHFARMFFDRCLEVMRAKNARYAGEEDPFRNLRRGGVFGIAVRMDDKVSRMLTLSHPLNKLDGLDESIEDTAVDMANYAMLMLALKTNLGGK